MKDLSIQAKVYVIATILVGLVLLVYSLAQLEWSNAWMVLALITCASVALIFKVEGSTNRSHYNISFLVYAFSFTILGPNPTVLVILVSNLIDWAWHKYPWYIQCFNISSYIFGIQLAGIVYLRFDPNQDINSMQGILALLASIAVFTLLNHLMVGIVIWLARGERLSKSGVLSFFPLMLDFTLMALGVTGAMLWLANSYAILLAVLPLYLIYSTLRVPALERQSELDPKTGLFNARYFERALQNELNRANRFDRPLTIVMADLDLLRNINNTYGHLAGDQVLIGIANILKASVRDYDVVVRFGGEEYAILMPETTTQEAFPRIESIREEIEKTEFNIPTSVTSIRATMSFGIAGRIGFDQSPSDIVHNADAALYYAKLKGRNGTYVYSENGFISHLDETERPALSTLDPLDESVAGIRRVDTLPFKPSPLRKVPEVNPTQQEQSQPEVEDGIQPKTISHPRWVVKIFIATLAAGSLALFALNFDLTGIQDWFGLSLFVLMVILTEWLSIDIYIRNTAISTSAAPILAGTLIYGPFGALILSLTFAIVAMAKYRSPVSRLIFNFSNQLTAAMLYTLILQVSGIEFLSLEPVMQLLLCLAFMGIVYFVTTGLVSLGMSLDFGQPGREIWREKYSWLAPYYLAMGLIAYALVFSYEYAGLFGVFVILVPLLLLRLSQLQYIDKTKAIVFELRAKNVTLEKSTQEINKLSEGLLNTLAEVVDLRDPDVLGHSKQVAYYAVVIARKLGLPPKQVELIRKAGLLHDIGKIGITETILFKPEALTTEEYLVVKKHVTLGAELLQASNSLAQLIPIIRQHHEHFDGNGYPDGLAGNNIPLEARIMAVADAIEAMASDRPYRPGLTYREILEELNENAGTQFDPMVVNAFLELAQLEGCEIIKNASRNAVLTERTPVS
jgi:diguanylate cyclase (GGDEF)-like protein/putative nucleotidyltransferase with HDIG domain